MAQIGWASPLVSGTYELVTGSGRHYDVPQCGIVGGVGGVTSVVYTTTGAILSGPEVPYPISNLFIPGSYPVIYIVGGGDLIVPAEYIANGVEVDPNVSYGAGVICLVTVTATINGVAAENSLFATFSFPSDYYIDPSAEWGFTAGAPAGFWTSRIGCTET